MFCFTNALLKMKRIYILFLLIFSVTRLFSQPTADFTSSGNNLCAPAIITFTNTSTGCSGTPTFYWTSGTSDVSSLENPTFSYTVGGTYTVSLKITCDGFEDTKTMTIVVYDPPEANFSNVVQKGCVPFDVNFIDMSLTGDAAINSWVWHFGDGTSSTEQHPSHTYASSGSFNVTLFVKDENNCSSQVTHNNLIRVANLPTVSFVADNPTLCTSPHTVNFSSSVTTSFGLTATYLWNFGDGGTSIENNPSHTYTSGIYDVSLTVTDEYGCENTFSKPEYVRIEPAVPQYSVLEGDTVCKGMQTHFLNETGYSCRWDFGDGGTSMQNTPIHIYQQTGNVNVTFTVDPGGQCEASTEFTLFVETITASFTTNPTNLYSCSIPFEVEFTNTSSANATSFYYVFQDGTSSIQPNPSHTYSSGGIFQPTLTVTSNAGCVHTFMGPIINISPADASFTADEVEGCEPLTITFTYSGDPEAITNFNWNFGNGNTNSDGSAIESSVYNAGEYTVVLTVTDGQGCTGESSLELNIGAVYEPNINVFDNDPDHTPLLSHNICAQDTVSLWVLEWDNEDYEFTWWIDSTSNKDVSNEYTDHAFDQDTGWVHLHMITLYNGCRDTIYWDSLYISGPIIDGISKSYDCNNPRNYEFTLNETIADTWDWKIYYIHEGTMTIVEETLSSTDHNYSYTFPPSPDSFWVKVTAHSDTTSCEYVDSIQIKIATPSASFSIPVYNNCTGVDISFDASASQDASEYYWDFGDGNNSGWLSEPIFIYQYMTVGVFDVVLTVRDENGCEDTDTHPIHIIGPEIHTTISETYGCDQLLVSFSDFSTASEPIVSVEWNFGDGSTMIGTDVTHLYSTPGVYSVTVNVTTLSNCGLGITYQDTIVVESVDASFNALPVVACVNQDISFQALENNISYIYTWNFGDTNPAISGHSPSINYSYENGGYYDVHLKVENGRGCEDELLLEGFIKIEQAFANFSLTEDHFSCYPATPIIIQNSSVLPADTELYYQWILGSDNDTITVEEPTYVYTVPGNFDIVLNLSTPAGCTDTHSLPLIIEGPYAQMNISDTIACVGQEIEFSLTEQENVETIQWVVGGGDSYTVESFTHSYSMVPPSGYYTVNLVIKSGDCQPPSFVQNIYIFDVTANFSITDTENNEILGGLCSPFEAMLVSNSINDDFRYWFVDNHPIGSGLSTETHNFVNNQSYDTSGEITLIVEDIHGCLDTIKKSIDVYALPVIEITQDTIICKGDEIKLYSAGGVSYLWSPDVNISDVNSQSPSVKPEEDIIYYLEVRNSHDCLSIDSVSILVIQDFLVNFTPVYDSIIIGDTTRIILEATQDSLIYTWTPSTNISCTNCPEPEFYPLEDTRYRLVVEDSTGCFKYHYLLDIFVIEEYTLDVPGAFTPGSGDKNAVIYARGFGIKKLLQFRIYNRWGEEVFYTDDINQGWNGYYKGKLQSIDNYSYFIEAEMFNGSIQTKKGHIMLIR